MAEKEYEEVKEDYQKKIEMVCFYESLVLDHVKLSSYLVNLRLEKQNLEKQVGELKTALTNVRRNLKAVAVCGDPDNERLARRALKKSRRFVR